MHYILSRDDVGVAFKTRRSTEEEHSETTFTTTAKEEEVTHRSVLSVRRCQHGAFLIRCSVPLWNADLVHRRYQLLRQVRVVRC